MLFCFFFVIIWPCDCISMRCKNNCTAVNNVKQGCILKDCLPTSQVCTKVTSLWGQYDHWTFSMFPTLRQCIMGSLSHQQVYCTVRRRSFLSCKDMRIWVYSSGLCMSQIIASQFDIVSHLTLQTTEKFQASRFVCGSFIVQPQCSLCEGGINSQIIAQKQIVICWKHCFAEPLCPASTRKKQTNQKPKLLWLLHDLNWANNTKL